jgi:hypothetical protein
MRRLTFAKAYRQWKVASAPEFHLRMLLNSELVDPTLKPVLRAEAARLHAMSEPLRQASIAASQRETMASKMRSL